MGGFFGSGDKSTSTTSNVSTTSVDIDDLKASGGDGSLVAGQGASIVLNETSGDALGLAQVGASVATNALGLANADNARVVELATNALSANALVSSDAIAASVRITDTGARLADNVSNAALAAASRVAADAQRAATEQAAQAQAAAARMAADAQRAAIELAAGTQKAATVLTQQGLTFAENLGTAGLKTGENIAIQNAKLADSVSNNALLSAIRLVESQNTVTESTRLQNNQLAQSIAENALGVANPAGQLGNQIQEIAKYGFIAAAVIGVALFLRRRAA